jgi:predicted GIY-YIG superfamily endonuclease
MPKKPRDTVTYDLKQGRKVVYRGTTNDPEQRAQQHQNEGKKLAKLTVTSRKMTDEGAKQKEAEALEKYRGNHGGKNPKYNKDDDG